MSSDKKESAVACVKVLLLANRCIHGHIVQAKTDAYLDLSSIWNVNVDRWLGNRFIHQADYSDNSFGVHGSAGLTAMRYKYTARFLAQDSVHVPNELFTSLCCDGIGTWYGNIVVCTHEPDSGEVLSISWDSTSKKFHWTEKTDKDAKRRPRDLTLDDVPEVLHLVSWLSYLCLIVLEAHDLCQPVPQGRIQFATVPGLEFGCVGRNVGILGTRCGRRDIATSDSVTFGRSEP